MVVIILGLFCFFYSCIEVVLLVIGWMIWDGLFLGFFIVGGLCIY